jgi:Rrf2 family nitric oxide-sensitive transcriptional repressor
MQLTMFSDYAMRIALYLAMHRERLVSVEEVSRAYGISRAHLVKVVQRLTELGVVTSVRGRGGGLRLGKAPEDVDLGMLVRATEPHLDLVECFDEKTNTCPIDRACGLKGILVGAQRAFLSHLDGRTLAELIPNGPRLVPLWRAKLRRAS